MKSQSTPVRCDSQRATGLKGDLGRTPVRCDSQLATGLKGELRGGVEVPAPGIPALHCDLGRGGPCRETAGPHLQLAGPSGQEIIASRAHAASLARTHERNEADFLVRLSPQPPITTNQ